MKRGDFILLVFVLGCQPHFQSGKTLCSDKGECPSGFVCRNDGTNNVCVDTKAASGGRGGGRDGAADSRTDGPGSAGGRADSGAGSGGTGAGGTGGSSACAATPVTSAACSGGVADASVPDTRVPDTAPPDARVPDTSPDTTMATCPSPAAGGACNVSPACGCPTGQVCYPDTPSTGLICMSTDGLPSGADCSGGQVCAVGLGCFGQICGGYCQSDSDCAAIDSARACLPTYWYTGAPIPGVSVCARVCDPANPQFPRRPLAACPAGFGCIPGGSNPGASQCVPQAGTGIFYSSCYTSTDCSPGYYCTTSYFCAKYCFTTNDCPLGSTCTAFFTPSYAGTASVGYCY